MLAYCACPYACDRVLCGKYMHGVSGAERIMVLLLSVPTTSEGNELALSVYGMHNMNQM